MAFPTGWARRVAITIEADQVDADLTDFPVCIRRADLPDEVCSPSDGNAAQANGGDLRFSSDSAGTTQLSLQVVSFEHDTVDAAGDAEVELYVKVASVANASDTTIYLWYKAGGSETQPAASASFGSESVWDANYVAVYHMNQDPSGSAPQILDSTANDNHGTSAGTMTSGDLVAGPIGNGIDFDATDDAIALGDDPFDLDPLTVEAIIDTSVSSGDRAIVSKTSSGHDQWSMVFDGGGGAMQFIWSTAAGGTYYYKATDAVGLNDGAPHCVAVAAATTTPSLTIDHYVDGVLDNMGFTSGPSGSPNPSDTGICHIGMRQDGIWPFGGIIDEVRISSVMRSAAWLKATYNNLKPSSTFLTAGTPAAVTIQRCGVGAASYAGTGTVASSD